MPLILRLCLLYGSQNKQRLLPYTTLRLFFRTKNKSVYCEVRTESLYKTHAFRLQRANDAHLHATTNACLKIN
jgi:hypothetical protein